MIQYSSRYRRALLAAAILASLLAGCSTLAEPIDRKVQNGVAILGVTEVAGVKAGSSRAVMTRDLADLVTESDRFRALRASIVRKAIDKNAGQDLYSAILTEFGTTGTLQPHHVRALMAARLPVGSALIARVVRNEVKPQASRVVRLRDRAGEMLDDRVRVMMYTQRIMELDASLINLKTGRIDWSRTYRAKPANDNYYDVYSGSSFSGSLAATLKNTMINGLDTPDGPEPPGNQLTLRSLMREVVRNMPD